jgi:hypothetical protein
LLLGPLGDNGGLTLPPALLSNNPAIDAGDRIPTPWKDPSQPARIFSFTLALCRESENFSASMKWNPIEHIEEGGKSL